MAGPSRRVAALLAFVGLMTFRSAFAQDARPAREPIEPDQNLTTLTLVRSSDGKAVVRFGKGPLRLIARGDRLGRRRAEVVEIAAGRVVIDEPVAGRDGQPNRARIILKDGETGGRRFSTRLDEVNPDARRSRVVVPRQ